MRINSLKSILKTAVYGATVLLLGAGVAGAQTTVALTAAPTSTTLPDGSTVPMWGYTCGTGSPAGSCVAANPNATGAWSPVIITVATGTDLQINLTNSLSFTPTGGGAANTIPTSIVIVGQLGGGLGTSATTTQSPPHDNQGSTWPMANNGSIFTPPTQGPRVQSFSTEVMVTDGVKTLNWTAPRPGTYLLESGTHPSIQAAMGLIGIVVVTAPPSGGTAGTAYPGVNYNAEVPLIFSEIDPVQNRAVDAAVRTAGFSESATYGAFLNGPVASIAVTSGGSGYTSAPTVHFTSGSPTASATAVVDTDPSSPTYRQVTEIDIVNGGGYAVSPEVTLTGGGGTGATAIAALQLAANGLGHCQSAAGPAAACYPPVVNYTPLYYLINGAAFDKTNASRSLIATMPATGITPGTGQVLVRLVNAGSRMHVPSIVGSSTGTANAGGFSLIAEDGNVLPGVPRVQSEVFMAAGKTYDITVNAPVSASVTLPPKALAIYDRELSLSANATSRDAGMLAYISVNGGGVPADPALGAAAANPDSFAFVVPGKPLTISDASQGVIANDVNIYAVQATATTLPVHGTVTLNPNGTFTYIPSTDWTLTSTSLTDQFSYCGNGQTSGAACTTVTLSEAPVENATGITLGTNTFTANTATFIKIATPGLLTGARDDAGYPLSIVPGSTTMTGASTFVPDSFGGFTATVPSAGLYTINFTVKNSQGTTKSATATVMFPAANGPTVTVMGKDPTSGATTTISDYRWIIEEDRTFYVDPNCTTNPPPAGCPTAASGIVPTFGTNFHTSFMPVVATGCTGEISCESGQTINGSPVVCDVGNGGCRTGAEQTTSLDPSQVHLDPTKHYYISVLPGDAANAFETGNATGGHGMGGAQIAPGQSSVTVIAEANPYPPSKLAVFVFEDDFPLNGEQDAGGGVDVLAPNEPGLGQFNITIFDDAGGSGDATGQVDYDMFNQPLSNSLAGTIDPATGLDACPLGKSRTGANDPTQTGITGTIVTCGKYEGDGTKQILSPLAGQAIVANMMPGRYGVVATPGADRIANGEEWLQTNTLDGQKAHDSFLRIGEAGYFQEYGPASYHVAIGFANPKIINGRLPGVCNGSDINVTGTNCKNTVTGLVTTERMSRTPDERLYSSGDNSSFSFTQCYVSIGDPDGEDFAFTKCNSDGTFSIAGLPDGDWRVTVFDQWNDMLVDGLSTPVRLAGGKTTDLGQLAINQWQANIYTTTFFDKNGNGVRDPDEQGLALVPTNIRFRDGSFSNFNSTDLDGYAGFNEVFPLFSWYVVETDSTRYKNTGTHVVYDAGGPSDGSTCGPSATPPTAQCGSSNIGNMLANTFEATPLPANLHVPGALYCDTADCTGTRSTSGVYNSTGRVDPPWVLTEGWQGFSGQNNFLEFGKTPFAAGENGGIKGHVVYASTRPFDDPTLLLQLSWEPLVPNVTINLYQEGTAPDGTKSLKLVDTTKTSSFDDWAQGFRSDGIPNMNCPGQTTSDPFYFSLYNQPNWLDQYNNVLHGTGGTTPLPNNAQYKCYDGMHNWNQLQPAPYDGMYQFPSIAGRNPTTGAPTGGAGSVAGTNCTICVANPADGTPMLPDGKYVVEMVMPPGYELVKEEDKNILIGDNFIAPVTVEFPGLGGAVFILPDQAEVAEAYNPTNPQNPTNDLGRTTFPSHESDTGSLEKFWPCVGEARTVPDYISLFPGSQEVAPFAGATRNLCDRKEVSLDDQTSVLAKFYLFTSAHAAAHFTGVITDDFTSEFDPFSPQFGEKFAPPNLPISLKDWTGTEVSRVYTDQWGAYDGLTYSTWEVNPPNPTGYSPTMMVTCMNDPGTGTTPDPLFNPGYSQFCYEIPFMPGQTQYMDTPVTPTTSFSEGYNHPDCAYPEATPAISEVDGDTSQTVAGGGIGPWVSAAGHTLTIKALGDQVVLNNGYSGPQATNAPFNQKTVTRHYGFGATQGSGTVKIGGKTATVTPGGWSESQITVTVPTGVANCAVQQQAIYGGSTAQCGELVITAGNGKQSIDTVTVTIGGKAPTRVSATTPMTQTGPGSLQAAIDNAMPGDLLILQPGTYNEMVLMWKPVRLQGVGAASSIINANTQPEGKLDPWRQKVNCLFGLALNGQPVSGPTAALPNGNPFDPTGTATCGGWPGFNGGINNPQVDRLPLEGILGWDTTVNGNLAQLLQEPTLMGAYEGAGITVLGKGVNIPAGSTDIYGSGSESAFPTGTTLLTSSNCLTGRGRNQTNPYPSNFQCNPSSIDGLSITNSSQGGGGVFVHAWGHNLQIANNRVYNNSGTLTGGITVGQGESPDAYLAGTPADSDPGSCQTTTLDGRATLPNTQLPYCFNLHVNVHNNSISLNSSIGDELFSSTPAGGGGVTMCIGADYYKFNYNWVCGNLSTGDGGGLVHLGYIYHGDIENNSILFNESTNPTVPTNGGGLIVMGAPPDGLTAAGLECGNTVADADCTPGLSDGTGPGLVINANLIQGNGAESGSGGGVRFQGVNGTDVVNFPLLSGQWNDVSITNNIITNNVAGWDGAGVSLQDALKVNIVNNTIMSNDTTASSGVLFNTLGAPISSAPGSSCIQDVNNPTTSCPQPAGLAVVQNSAVLDSVMPSTVLCPAGHGTIGSTCKDFSVPVLYNNLIWQNRAFYIGVNSANQSSTNPTNQQSTVALFNAFTGTAAATQPTTDASTANGNGSIITGGTGACVTPASYWEIGVRGDKGPADHSSGLTLAPTYSVLTDAADYPGASNSASNPTVGSQYCNGSRTPPEFQSLGYQVPPGISDATVPNPIFNLTPAATVDEGNNWINISWGPLALTNPVTNTTLGNYALSAGSPSINYISNLAVAAENIVATVPKTDFFGNTRPQGGAYDVGAVEYVAVANTPIATVTGGPLAFGSVATGTTSTAQTLTLANSGTASVTGITVTVTAPFSRSGGTCGATLTAGSNCTITVVFSPTAVGAATGTATISSNVSVSGSPVNLSGTGIAPVVSATLTPTSHAYPAQTRAILGCGAADLGCLGAPTQVFTLTNTGNVPLTGIAQSTLGGANPTEFNIDRVVSTCGPNGNSQILGPNTTLAPGATCVVTVAFHPLRSQTTGAKSATVSVTDAAGTQSSTLTGTAN